MTDLAIDAAHIRAAPARRKAKARSKPVAETISEKVAKLEQWKENRDDWDEERQTSLLTRLDKVETKMDRFTWALLGLAATIIGSLLLLLYELQPLRDAAAHVAPAEQTTSSQATSTQTTTRLP